MKTAVEEVLELFNKEIKFINGDDSREDKYWQSGMKHAKSILEDKQDMFKQQIIKAYDDAFNYVVGGGFVAKTGKQYFEEMYGSTNKENLK